MPRPLLLVGLILATGLAPSLLAMGSPPLLTDDPGTPGDGHWEINLGLSTEQRPGVRAGEMPLLDLNYGVGDRLQLKYEIPYLTRSEGGAARQSGLGNSGFGVKWRFYDTGEKGTAVSAYPQIEFRNPGSHAAERGLVDPGTTIKLPFQFQQEVGPVTLNAQFGREIRREGDSWFYGIVAGHHLTGKVEVAAELAGAAEAGLGRSLLAANVGVTIGTGAKTSLMFSLGRELHNHFEAKATLLAYVGLQLRL
jgi:hypothetical protein